MLTVGYLSCGTAHSGRAWPLQTLRGIWLLSEGKDVEQLMGKGRMSDSGMVSAWLAGVYRRIMGE